MRKRYRTLILWSLITYFTFYEIRDIAIFGWEEVLSNWTTTMGIVLSFSAITHFTLFSIGSYTIFFHFYHKTKKYLTGLLLLNLAIVILLRFTIEEVVFPPVLGFDNFADSIPPKGYFFTNLYYGLVFSAVGIVFYLIQYVRFKEQKEQNLVIENKKIELAFLRSQVNPHFLFNVMNNIYALVYRKSERALHAIEQLTGMLRYTLYEKSDWVPLAKELKYIDHLIDLEKMRYDFELPIHLEIEEGLGDCIIPPFTLLGLVENALKHAELKDAHQPITIILEDQNEDFQFQIKNTKSNKERDQSGGIGLLNLSKRLQILYGDLHDIQVKNLLTSFEVCLRLPKTPKLNSIRENKQ